MIALILRIISKLKANATLIFILLGIAVFGYLVITNRTLSKKVDNLRAFNAQLEANQQVLIEGSKEYVKLSDLKEFKEQMDSTTDAILKAQQIKPKWVDEVVKTTVIYNNTDTTITNTIYNNLSGVYDWKVVKDCINTEGYVTLIETNDSTNVDVAITKQSATFNITGVKYEKKTKEFKIFKKTIFRYGPRAARVTSSSDCGEVETVITEVQK